MKKKIAQKSVLTTNLKRRKYGLSSLGALFLNIWILWGEQQARENSDWYKERELFILYPTALVPIFADLLLGCS